ncbi:uncharacterized protein LOC115066416 isoform X3 [Bactrocera dorsalis]|uniref:Uncharacterized protein LOC115066416 isoform X3 n=1 Tax=Bactrocera dorsalis TaxID=27457 RepID=A0ABM3JTK2_BACDO|nr:uncharacterized protein LOC115066416 isoform X3 [Bactrocera dorsalis]
MVLKTFVLFFWLFYFVSIGNTSKISYVFSSREDSCSSIWDRPRHTSLVPPTRFQFENNSYNGNRHHVIPFQILRNFFNSAVRQSRQASRIARYLSAYISTIVAQFISNGETIQHHNPIPVDDEVVIVIDPLEEMFAALSWLPGNIFIGPAGNYRHHDDPLNQRGGDPGNAFEQYANRIIRDDTHFTALQNLNRDMRLYINDPSDVNLFHQIMINLDIVNRRNTPFPFDAQDWEIVNGKFYIRDRHREKRSQSQIPQPPIASNTKPSTNDDPFDYYVGFCRAVKQQLTASHFSSIKKKTIDVDNKMTFDCPKTTFILVKQATLHTMPWTVAVFSLGLACLSGDCVKRDGTEKLKKLCNNKRSCLFSDTDTEGLSIDVEYYCADVLTPLKEREELQKPHRWSSSEFELNCPFDYGIRITKAMRHSSSFYWCIIDDCTEKDITAILREKCDGLNPCKNKLDNWGMQPITVDFSCIPNPSMFA